MKYVPYERAYPSVESEIHFAVLPDITLSKVSSFGYYTEIEVTAVCAQGKVSEYLQCADGTPLLLIERTFIRQDGKRIGYALHYALQPYGQLKGRSGHMQ